MAITPAGVTGEARDKRCTLARMQPPGFGEIVFILVLCAVVFLGSKVNPIGDAVGGFIKGLRRGMTEDKRIQVRTAPRDRTPPA